MDYDFGKAAKVDFDSGQLIKADDSAYGGDEARDLKSSSLGRQGRLRFCIDAALKTAAAVKPLTDGSLAYGNGVFSPGDQRQKIGTAVPAALDTQVFVAAKNLRTLAQPLS